MNKAFLLALLIFPVSTAALGADQDAVVPVGKEPLIATSIDYGIKSRAYLSSPVGMVTEGYRYQLRAQYLSFLDRKMSEPGHTIQTINDQLLSSWMNHLGRESIAPEVLVGIKRDLESKLDEWSGKSLTGQFAEFGTADGSLERINQRIQRCSGKIRLASSNLQKRDACYGSESITRDISQLPDSASELEASMQKLIYPYVDQLAQLQKLDYYEAYQVSRDTFRDTVVAMVSKGYSVRQLAELLDFAGVDYPQVYDRLYYYALGRENAPVVPAQVVLK